MTVKKSSRGAVENGLIHMVQGDESLASRLNTLPDQTTSKLPFEVALERAQMNQSVQSNAGKPGSVITVT